MFKTTFRIETYHSSKAFLHQLCESTMWNGYQWNSEYRDYSAQSPEAPFSPESPPSILDPNMRPLPGMETFDFDSLDKALAREPEPNLLLYDISAPPPPPVLSNSVDSVFSSLMSSMSSNSAFPSRQELKPEPIDPDDDGFFDLSDYDKGRSASFGGFSSYRRDYATLDTQKLAVIPGSASIHLYESSETVNRLGATSAASTGLLHSPDGNNTFSPGWEQKMKTEDDDFRSNISSPAMNGVPPSGASDTSADGKKSTTRRNAWGNMSYADLITQAILNSPEKRLTLSQVYEWMVQNVPYFRDKGDSNSSAGWKNSIRHNLSLHSRFMRIQNEGAGKSSWWVINPDAKPGRNPRRARASTMDATSKAAIDKKRRGARKKVQDMRIGLHSGVPSLAGSTSSIIGHDILYNDDESGSFDQMFRSRTGSNISVPGTTSRVTPSSLEHPTNFEDFEFPPWVTDPSVTAIPSDIVDRTDQMSINTGRSMVNGVKQEQKPPLIKSEPVAPPSYHELNSVRGPSQLQNPLLRNHPLNKFPVAPAGFSLNLYPSYWPTPSLQSLQNPQSCAAQQSVSASVGNALPIDLENLTLPDQPLMEMDVESLLRHELSQTRDHQINFDI